MARSWRRFRGDDGYRMVVQLTEGEVAILRRSVVGQGGFQTFLRDLVPRIRADLTLHLTRKDIATIKREAAHAGGDGGFEGRLQQAFGRTVIGDRS